jgi:Protein of unknown function (DUF2723)
MRDFFAGPAGAALLTTVCAAWLYSSTLMPGFDLGDTASFQTMAGSPDLTPRDGYPLYYAIGAVVLWLSGAEPAYAMNLASALTAAAAIGVIVLVASDLSGSVLAAVVAALLFAGSYTFWSQTAIAEVYALHILCVALCLYLLLRYQRLPTTVRLWAFLAVFAASFGNHLSMILLLPAAAFFLAGSSAEGWPGLLSARSFGLALVCALGGVLMYAWHFSALWASPYPPASVLDAVGAFWFDVTKSDWRETMVLRIPPAMAGERLAMYAFDVRQQFGLVGPAAAIAGAGTLWRTQKPRAVLLIGYFLVTWLFAMGYNVGDAHVFFLPSHLVVALLAAPCLVWMARLLPGRRLQWVQCAALALVLLHIYQTYPAVDRSGDRRPTELLTSLSSGISDQKSVLVTDLNWQVQNGMYYFTRYVRPDVGYTRATDIALYAPALAATNQAIGRDIVVTDRARRLLTSAYGPLFHFTPLDPPSPSLRQLTDGLKPGTPYVLVLLRPTREFALDHSEWGAAIAALTRGEIPSPDSGDYTVVAGLVGRPPDLVRIANDPFDVRLSLAGTPVLVRLEGWLEFDTTRRMGFGHVIAGRGFGRQHTLIVERGLSFVAFDAAGRPQMKAYRAGIYEPIPRYRATLVR